MLVKHAGGNKFQWNAQEFGASQRSIEVVIFCIHSENLHVFGHCGLKKEFDDWHGCGQRRSLTGIVDAIATNSATNAVRNIARLITLHLYLRVVISGVFSSIDRLSRFIAHLVPISIVPSGLDKYPTFVFPLFCISVIPYFRYSCISCFSLRSSWLSSRHERDQPTSNITMICS